MSDDKQRYGYEELQLYLQQAQEDLLSSFEGKDGSYKVSDTGNIKDVHGVINNTAPDRLTINVHDSARTGDSKGVGIRSECAIMERASLTKGGHILKSKQCLIVGDQNNNCDMVDVRGRELDLLMDLQGRGNKQKMSSPKLKGQKSKNKLCGKSPSELSKFDTTEVNNNDNLAKVKIAGKKSLPGGNVKRLPSKPKVPRKKAFEKDLHNFSDSSLSHTARNRSGNENLASRVITGVSTSKIHHNISDNPDEAGNPSVCGSVKEVIQGNTSSLSCCDTQINGKQSAYLTGDKSQLDNRKFDREIEGGKLMSFQTNSLSISEKDGACANKSSRFIARKDGNCKNKKPTTTKECGLDISSGEGRDLSGCFIDTHFGSCIGKDECNSSCNVPEDRMLIKSTNGYKSYNEQFSSTNDQLGARSAIKDDLEEFLEEINESIDELISDSKIGKMEKMDSCCTSDFRDEESLRSVVSSSSTFSSKHSALNSAVNYTEDGNTFLDETDCATSEVNDLKCNMNLCRSVESKSTLSDSGVSFNFRSDLSESLNSFSENQDDKPMDLNNDSFSHERRCSSRNSKEMVEPNFSASRELSLSSRNSEEVVKTCLSASDDQNCSSRSSKEMIETDAGFYWLTCSIEEGSSNVDAEWSGIVSEEVSETVNIKLDSDIGSEPETLNEENREIPTVDLIENEALGKVVAKTGIDDKASSDTTEYIPVSSIKEQDTDSTNVGCADLFMLPNLRKQLNCSSPELSGINKPSKQKLNNLPVESSVRNDLKRKYSCPPNAFKIFKVVSVDIPKLESTGKQKLEISDILKQHVKTANKFAKSPNQTMEAEPVKRHSYESALLAKKKSENVQHLKNVNGEIKRHSYESRVESKVPEEFKRSSLDSVLSRKKNNNKIDKYGLYTRFEPPAMFRDKPTEDNVTGPILKPPPEFDSDGQEVSVMSTQHLPPPVWDPGAPPTTSCQYSGEVTRTGRRFVPLPTLPPPPVEDTENLISSTLNQHKQRKCSGDTNSGLDLNKISDTARRKSVDSGMTSEYAELDFSGKESVSSRLESEDENIKNSGRKFKPKSKSDKGISENSSCGINDTSQSDVNRDFTASELAKMLDLIESYTNCSDPEDFEYAKIGDKGLQGGDINVCKSERVNDSIKCSVNNVNIESDKSEKCVTIDEDDTSAIYATVDKHRPRKATPEKEVPSPLSNAPPPIPPKPKFLSENLDRKNHTKMDSEQCSEIQVMFNSLSPVLLRRSNSTRSHRRNESSTETSPDSTPCVSPRGMKPNAKTDHKGVKVVSKQDETNLSESLFMDPEMSKTWHGATSTDWTQYYGPQMKAMMRELSELTNGARSSPKDRNTEFSNNVEDSLESRSKTLPSKSLLDQMHKKFCADQYSNEKDAALARALVLFRLKSHPPPKKSKRSQSFNIRMGTSGASYLRQGMTASRQGTSASSSSTSSDSSPLFPRAMERLRIKTRADVQYSPKPTRARGVTPDRIPSEIIIKAQQTQKEEAEIEAIEACRWLRETGFPQYAQLYEDGQFPVDIDSVEKDHDFLDKEDIQSLFRRLNTLNKCAIMKIGTPSKKESEDSDEEDPCALSDKWKYQRSSRRWSRKDLEFPVVENNNGQAVLKSASSHDSLLADQNSSSETGDSPVLDSKMLHEDMVIKTVPTYDANGNATMGISPNVIRRAASDRIKGAKSFLKRMESLKGKRSRKNKTITEISGPVITDNADMQAKIKHLNCRDINSTPDVTETLSETPEVVHNNSDKVLVTSHSASELITSPRVEALTTVTSPDRGDQSSALNNTNSSALNSSDISNTTLNTSADVSQLSTNGALSLDMSTLSRQSNSSDTTNSSQETLFIPGEYRPGKFPTLLDDSLFTSDSNIRTRSFSYADDTQDKKHSRRGSHDPRKQLNRISIYDNVPIEEDLATAQEELDIILSELFQNINGLNKAINGENAELLQPPSPLLLDDSSVSTDSQTGDNEANINGNSVLVPDLDENEVISGTLSSPDISDHEIPTEDMSHDDSAEHIVVRERRDSGVGSSLTRTNSERRKYRIRWHSFQKSHRPTSESRNLQLYNLSAGQIQKLRKYSLLKLTALIEKYAPNRSGWSLTVPRFMKRHKVPDYKDKNVFGVSFAVMIQRSGQALPQCILHAMRFLRRTAADALGIFRKSGVRSRIQKLRNDMEADPESVDFNELQAYDVADLVKQYFRELPECLLTNKLSDIFTSIFIYVPLELRLDALQAAVVLMTDENRDVLQSLLLFLSDIAKHASTHQMTASNLAVCFAPSLFNMGGVRNPSQTPSPRRNRKNPGIPDARELMEQKAAHECLTVMINECKKLFTIPSATLCKCRVVLHEDPVITLEELNKHTEDGQHGYMAHIDSCIQGLLKESREKFRGWVSVSVHNDVDVSYKKVGDGHPLRLWKCTVDVEAPPNEVLNRVLNDRQKWDEDLLQWNTVEKLDAQTEVFQYERNSMAPHPTRDYCVLRSWKTDLPKGACVLISTSIDHEGGDLLGGIRGVELASRYLIEPCGTGKSRLTHISRVDMRGHSPEWYKKVYGHICANFMDRIRASFRCNSDGPETKV